VKLAFTLHRLLPSASCQGVGVLKFGVFRGSITWPVVPPVNASYPALRPCPHDSEPVWLARPSPYDSFIRYILPACPVRSASCSLKVVATASKNTVLTHRMLALRHVIPNWVAVERLGRSDVYVREHVEDEHVGWVVFTNVNARQRS
jgi:hypothetical protein